MSSTTVLNRLLDPLSEAFTLKSAKVIVALRADPVAQAKLDDLAERNKEGELSPAEKAEYHSYVAAGNLVAILQSKARAFLKRHKRKK